MAIPKWTNQILLTNVHLLELFVVSHKIVSSELYDGFQLIFLAFCGLNNLMDVSNEDSTCFVGICKLVTPLYIKDISITDKTPGEFAIRLSLEGKFVYVDGKSSSSLGYSSLELLGKSYFEYIHVDDLDKIEDSFGKLNQCGEIQAPMYRLMTKGRQW